MVIAATAKLIANSARAVGIHKALMKVTTNVNATFPRYYADVRSQAYDKRKYSHHLPCDDVPIYFPAFHCMPSGVFRVIDGEPRLGCCAGKVNCYKNLEYFCFHHMSFYDTHMIMSSWRASRPVPLGKKPVIITQPMMHGSK